MSATNPCSLNWTPQGNFHHVGFVVSSIQECAHSFASTLNAVWDGHIIHDPNQGVRVGFLRGVQSADPLFELVEPVGENTTVFAFLKRGGGLHHVCYEVPDLEEALTRIRTLGALIARPPMPAPAFGNRRIAWVYTKNRLLIEYLERSRNGE
jgi:methylmalonyl-CoA/ethylmalonyl-CoA epimerase